MINLAILGVNVTEDAREPINVHIAETAQESLSPYTKVIYRNHHNT